MLLYDEIGNSYERKNLYLKQLFSLKEQLDDGTDGSAAKQALRELGQNKNKHPHIVALRDYQRAEKTFLSQLKAQRSAYSQGLDKDLPGKLKSLQTRLFLAQKKKDFYESYQELSYDAELHFKENTLIVQQLPDIITQYEQNRSQLLQALEDKKNLDREAERTAAIEYKRLRAEQNQHFRHGVKILKSKKKKGLISHKALVNGIAELKHKRDEINKVNSYTSKKKAINELIANKRYTMAQGLNLQLKVLKSNISDVRRVTPVETEHHIPWYAFAGIILPGLGQLLNRQYVKAALFFIGTLFLYFVAIPYALGYGNYQGTGVSGLITLAAGARRVDRSLIFMIEGIMAIFLLLIGATILIINFNDVFKTQIASFKGIRPRNWFETAVRIENEGFPYVVSIPALLVTLFIVMVPIMTAILLSFTGMDPQNQSKFPWVGLQNYQLIALGRGLAGSVFWLILGWTLVWTIVATTSAIVTGFMLAIIANGDRIKGKVFFRTVYLLPWAVPAFITIMFFSIMFSPNGAMTELISSIFGQRILIKNDPTLSRITLIALQTWLGSSYVFLLSTGVLQAIPGDLYEAAQIDGATDWQKLRRITLPIVLFQTAPLLVGQYTFQFNNFSIIWLFNQGGPFNPTRYGNLAGGTDLLISYIYKLVMENQYQAIGAAISIIIALGLMLFAFIGFKNSKAFKEERL